MKLPDFLEVLFSYLNRCRAIHTSDLFFLDVLCVLPVQSYVHTLVGLWVVIAENERNSLA